MKEVQLALLNINKEGENIERCSIPFYLQLKNVRSQRINT